MAAPTIAPAVAASIIGAVGSTVGGIGGGLLAKQKAKDEKQMQLEGLRGPVRGGSSRAGNQDEFAGLLNETTMEKLGQNTLPVRTPVYGQPIDLDALFQPKQFGQGFAVGNPRKMYG